ncbi:MAG: hypothetical protein DMD96_02950 [Candidatus Rokuibacteriota bacterium]|nr:MAG: hypothetical protein DMD96_02950 [Candidatus Rokubacteria bacterium]
MTPDELLRRGELEAALRRMLQAFDEFTAALQSVGELSSRSSAMDCAVTGQHASLARACVEMVRDLHASYQVRLVPTLAQVRQAREAARDAWLRRQLDTLTPPAAEGS